MIGISLLTLDPLTVGGTQTYAAELIRGLARHGTLDYQVLVPRIATDAGGELRSTVISEFPASRSRRGRVAGLARATLAGGRIARAVAGVGATAFHFPLTVMIPRVTAPAVVTVHDLQHEAFPQFFSRSQLAYRRRVYGDTVKRSKIVIAISEYVRGSLLDRYNLDPEEVQVVHHGIDHDRFSPGTGGRERFLLYPANRWPHKNHERLFAAFELIRRDRPELRLVLTGVGHEGKPLPLGAESRGHVTIDELVGLYRTAAALVFPTLYEGFGIPPLEAMACDCPVAVSGTTSLPEICRGVAVYFDPTSVEDIARGIADVLDGPPAGGPQRAAGFTWERCAHQHEAVYRALADD